MALDFHLANNKKEAPFKTPSCSIDGEMHKIIFTHKALRIEDYPFFGRLKDYYSDANYGVEEIQILQHEIESVKAINFDHPKMLEQLHAVSLACLEALEKRMGIWVYCD